MTMLRLDRDGIFRAEVLSWSFKAPEGKLSRAVSIQFKVLAQLENREWQDWTAFEDHNVWGDFWIVGKDGNLLTEQLDRLSFALNWSGDIREMQNGLPPERVVQITVKAETDSRDGVTRFKAQWINHKDWKPTPKNHSKPEDINDFSAQYGSQVRAALGAAAHARGKPPPKGKPTTSPVKRPLPPTLCPVAPSEGAEPLDGPGNQDDGNPFGDVPDEAGDAPPKKMTLDNCEETPFG